MDKSKARAEGALIEAKAQAEIERLRAETADFVLDREMRKTLNRNLIVAEAYKALPPPDQEVPKEAPSRDFIHNFFDEFDGVGDPEMQKIVGRLLAGEVVRPGSYHRKTLRVLRDLESGDFAQFTALCRFSWHFDQKRPLIFEVADPIYVENGVSFSSCQHLDGLGLLQFLPVQMVQTSLPPSFTVTYGSTPVSVNLAKGSGTLVIGHADFTIAGLQMANLTRAAIVPGFIDYVAGKWRAVGHTATVATP